MRGTSSYHPIFTDRIFHEINHPAFLGYPHDYGKPYDYSSTTLPRNGRCHHGGDLRGDFDGDPLALDVPP